MTDLGYSHGVRRLVAWWQTRGVPTQDAILAVMLGVLAFAPGLVGSGVDLAELPHHPVNPVVILLGLAQCLPLVARRVAPLVCLTVIVAAFAADQVLAYPPSFGSVGLVAALYAAGAYLDRKLTAATIATLISAYLGLCVALHSVGSPESPVQYVTFLLFLTGCWVVGRSIRMQRAGAEAVRAHGIRIAVADERARIARELHDIVTHHVTAMVVQSDATQFLLTDAPGRAADGLTAISDTGRHALTELRSLLDVLDGTPATRPVDSIDKVDELVARVRCAGQPIEFVERGTRRADIPDSVALAAYHVVREALTNAVKHAPGKNTTVHIDYTDDEIVVRVANARARRVLRTANLGGGRGLAGMRARVDAVGGELSAAPAADSGFVVRATLPLRAGW